MCPKWRSRRRYSSWQRGRARESSHVSRPVLPPEYDVKAWAAGLSEPWRSHFARHPECEGEKAFIQTCAKSGAEQVAHAIRAPYEAMPRDAYAGVMSQLAQLASNLGAPVGVLAIVLWAYGFWRVIFARGSDSDWGWVQSVAIFSLVPFPGLIPWYIGHGLGELYFNELLFNRFKKRAEAAAEKARVDAQKELQLRLADARRDFYFEWIKKKEGLRAEWQRLHSEEEEVARRAKERLLTDSWLNEMGAQELESLVGDLLTREGHRVQMVGGSGDEGLDLIAEKDGVTIAVQCKRYAMGRPVGPSEVREFFGAFIHAKAKSGLFVTTSGFSNSAAQFAQGKMTLVDREGLRAWVLRLQVVRNQ